MIIPGVVIFNIVLFDIWKQKNGLMRNPMKISYDELIFYQIETIFNPSENTQNKLNPKFYENVHEEIIMIFFFFNMRIFFFVSKITNSRYHKNVAPIQNFTKAAVSPSSKYCINTSFTSHICVQLL